MYWGLCIGDCGLEYVSIRLCKRGLGDYGLDYVLNLALCLLAGCISCASPIHVLLFPFQFLFTFYSFFMHSYSFPIHSYSFPIHLLFILVPFISKVLLKTVINKGEVNKDLGLPDVLIYSKSKKEMKCSEWKRKRNTMKKA